MVTSRLRPAALPGLGAVAPVSNVSATDWNIAKEDIAVAYGEATLASTRTFDTRAYPSVQAAIDTAYAAGGGTVFVGEYMTFLTTPLELKDKVYLTGRGSGATWLMFSESATTLNGCNIYGTGTIEQLPALVGASPKNGEVLTFDVSHGLVAKDLVLMHNPADGSFSPHRASYRDGEISRVLKTSGNSIYTAKPFYTNHGMSTNHYKINPIHTGISGMTVVGRQGRTLAKIEFADNPRFDDLVMTGSDNAHINLAKSFEPTISNVRAVDYSSDAPGLNYGIVIGGCQSVVIDKCHLETGRHGLTYGGDATIGSIPNRDVTCSNSFISGVSAGGGVTGFSPHGNSEYYTFNNVVFDHGCTIAGDKARFNHCTFKSSRWGGIVFGAEMLGADFVFDGCLFEATRHHPTSVFGFISAHWSSGSVGGASTRSGGKFTIINSELKLGPYGRDNGLYKVGVYLYNVDGLPFDNEIDLDGLTITGDYNPTATVQRGVYIRAGDSRGFRKIRAKVAGNMGMLISSTSAKDIDLRGTSLIDCTGPGVQVSQSNPPVTSKCRVDASNVSIVGAKGEGMIIFGPQSTADGRLIMDNATVLDCGQDGSGGSSVAVAHFDTVIRRDCIVGDTQSTPTQTRADTITNVGTLIDYDTIVLGPVTTQVRSGITTSRVRVAP